MSPRKKTHIGRLTAGAIRMRRKRAAESPTEKAKRLEVGRLRQALKRATETPEQRKERLEIERIRVRLLRKGRASTRKLKSEEDSSSGAENDFILGKKFLQKLYQKYKKRVGRKKRKKQSSVEPVKTEDPSDYKLEPPSPPLSALPV